MRGKRPMSKRQVALKHGFRSGLEEDNMRHLQSLGISAEYETLKLYYTFPESKHTYTPDFVLPNGIIIETKGRFLPADRKKHLRVKACNPELDIRFVFNNPNSKIRKGSKTTYGMWCLKNGFKYAKGLIPKEWIEE